MLVSGMAMRVRPVTTRSEAPCEMPMPPPITTPSISAI